MWSKQEPSKSWFVGCWCNTGAAVDSGVPVQAFRRWHVSAHVRRWRATGGGAGEADSDISGSRRGRTQHTVIDAVSKFTYPDAANIIEQARAARPVRSRA